MKLKTLLCLSLITLVTSVGLAAYAQTYSVIHSFTGQLDGAEPYGGVILRGGSLYGTTNWGGYGLPGPGLVYQITHAGSDWSKTLLFGFLTDGSGGAGPLSRIVVGPDGQFYGTTSQGGAKNAGVVFRLDPPSIMVCPWNYYTCWTETVLHSFGGGSDGSFPGWGDLVWDQQGNIYGTTRAGGVSNLGTVFQLTKSGDTWTETPIYSFSGAPDGADPVGGVIVDADGTVYGTTVVGGLHNCRGVDCGTVYKLTYTPGIGWHETILYTFTGGDDGANPAAGLTLDAAGNLYGATTNGGSQAGGTIFELVRSGDTYAFKVIYSIVGTPGFPNSGPAANLTRDAAGNFYGTTVGDGKFLSGSVFKLTNTQQTARSPHGVSGWKYTTLHDFTGGDGGNQPFSAVTIDTDGTLYGTASMGGSQLRGVVWMIKPKVVLTSLVLNPSSVKGGNISIATIMLNAPAPDGGLGVAMTTDQPLFVHPPSLVIVPGGLSSFSFAVRTSAVRETVVANVTASANASQVSAQLTVTPTYGR